MRHSKLKRLAGFVALTAFTVYSASALAGPPDFGVQQPNDAWHLWLLSPELPAGQVSALSETHRFSEAQPGVDDAPLSCAHPSRGPPA